jgi:hypothetical protein
MLRFRAEAVPSSIRNGKHKVGGREVGSEVLSLTVWTILSDVMPCSSIEVVLFLLVICLIFLLFDPGSGGSSFPPKHLIFYWITGNTPQKTISVFKMLCILSLG